MSRRIASSNSRVVVERLMLITSWPRATAHSSPASSKEPLPRFAGPSTRTLSISHPGASERMIPAHAVPCPNTSPSVSSTTVA